MRVLFISCFSACLGPLFIPMIGNGVYMGIFNMIIAIPMIIRIVKLPLYYRAWLGGNPENVIRLAGKLPHP